MKNTLIKKSFLMALVALSVIGCSKEAPTNVTPITETPDPIIDETLKGQFLVAAVVGDATYFLSTASLEDANTPISTIGNGYEYSNTFSNYLSNAYKGFVALKYGQGSAHIGQRVTIDATGKASLLGEQFELQNGFVTAGVVGENIFSIMSGGRSSDITLATINRVPMSTGSPDFAYFKVDAFTGYEGKNAQLIGLVDAGNGSFYTGLDFSSDGEDKVVVAKINANTQATEAVYSDDRLSFSGARYRSARYAQIGRASNGDVYVFSGNHLGTKKAGALLIKSGASGFDQDYFWDLETASGGYRFRKVWEVVDDIFLLEFYNESFDANVQSSGIATQFALVDMSDKKLSWITGLPDKSEIPDLGVKWPYVFDGKIYMGVTTSTEDPRFYVIDTETAKAAKGISVSNASSIEAATFVEEE